MRQWSIKLLKKLGIIFYITYIMVQLLGIYPYVYAAESYLKEEKLQPDTKVYLEIDRVSLSQAGSFLVKTVLSARNPQYHFSMTSGENVVVNNHGSTLFFGGFGIFLMLFL